MPIYNRPSLSKEYGILETAVNLRFDLAQMLRAYGLILEILTQFSTAEGRPMVLNNHAEFAKFYNSQLTVLVMAMELVKNLNPRKGLIASLN